MKEKIDLLYELLYNKSEKELMLYIKDCTESVMLHFIAANYNWDNGFDIPLEITKNNFCDMGTALMIFEYAEGYMMFYDDNWQEYFGENIDVRTSKRYDIFSTSKAEEDSAEYDPVSGKFKNRTEPIVSIINFNEKWIAKVDDNDLTINFISTVREIYSYAFAMNTALLTVNFSENITKIGSGAFYKCDNLRNLNFNINNNISLLFYSNSLLYLYFK